MSKRAAEPKGDPDPETPSGQTPTTPPPDPDAKPQSAPDPRGDTDSEIVTQQYIPPKGSGVKEA